MRTGAGRQFKVGDEGPSGGRVVDITPDPKSAQPTQGREFKREDPIQAARDRAAAEEADRKQRLRAEEVRRREEADRAEAQRRADLAAAQRRATEGNQRAEEVRRREEADRKRTQLLKEEADRKRTQLLKEEADRKAALAREAELRAAADKQEEARRKAEAAQRAEEARRKAARQVPSPVVPTTQPISVPGSTTTIVERKELMPIKPEPVTTVPTPVSPVMPPNTALVTDVSPPLVAEVPLIGSSKSALVMAAPAAKMDWRFIAAGVGLLAVGVWYFRKRK
jgi:hypothetical protein